MKIYCRLMALLLVCSALRAFPATLKPAVTKAGSGEGISVDIADMSIQDAMQILSDATGLNIIMSTKVTGKISAYVHNMESDRALREIIEVNGFHYVRKDNVVWVLSDDEYFEDRNLGRGREIIPLKFARPQDVAATLAGSLSKKAVVTAYPETNTIVVAELEDRIESVKALVRSLDVEPVSRVFQLNHAVAADMLLLLQPQVSSPNSLRADARTNQVTVTGTAETLDRIAKVLKEFDKPDKIATRVFPLKYANADATADLLRQVLTGQKQSSTSGVYGSQSGTGQQQQRVFTTQPGRAGAATSQPAGQTATASAAPAATGAAAPGAAKPAAASSAGPSSATPMASWQNYRATTSPGAQTPQTGEAQAAGGKATGAAAPGVGEEGAALGPLANVTADTRTNSVIVTHVSSVIERIAQIIESIDVPGEYNTYQFHNVNPDELKIDTKLAGLLPTEAPFLQVDPISRKVTFRASPEKAKEIFQLMKEWDEEVRQVRIEAEILRVNASLVKDLGINWQAVASEATDLGRINKVSAVVQFPATGVTTSSPQGSLTVGNLKHSDYTAVIQALDNDSRTEVIARPRILVRDNQQAVFSSTRDEPYTVVSVSGQTQTTLQDVRFLNVGVTLMVAPQVRKEGLVSMDTQLEISSLVEVRNGIPVVDRATAQSSISVQEGGTVLLGGLRQRARTKVDGGVPGLRKLPLIGHAFSNRHKEGDESEIILVLRPFIVGNTQDNVPSPTDVSSDVEKTMREKKLANPERDPDTK